MRKSWLLCVLWGTLAWGQAAPSAAPPPQPEQAPMAGENKPPVDTSASVPATAAVLTINGVCAPQPKAAAAKGATAKPGSTGAKDADAKTPSGECKTDRKSTRLNSSHL